MPSKWSPESYRDPVLPHAHNRLAVDDAAVVDRYVAGESENAIAKSLGCNRFVVRRRLMEAGITPRGQAAAETLKWAAMPAEQRAIQVQAAHAASKGRRSSDEALARRARGVEARGHATKEEASIGGWLQARGAIVRYQVAEGPYNIDVATGSVAVELFSGGWHTSEQHRRRAQKRARYLFDHGWHLLVIWTDKRRHPLGEVVAEEVVALADVASRDPASPRQYRVIWGDGELIASGSANEDYIPIERP